jgi:quercetin dioxygenase-like cupin family protein
METPNLDAVVREHLETARRADSGRAAETVYGGHEKTLRQTVIALTAGTELAEHENPGEATLLVLQGAVRLRSGDTDQEGRGGDLMAIPPHRHSLEALEDSAVLLTVAKLP